jgi:hypothetical protein
MRPLSSLALVVILVSHFAVSNAVGQSVSGNGTGGGGLTSGTLTPFVTAVVPVVGPNGRGVVGGIYIDTDGVVSRAKIEISNKLGRDRMKAIGLVAPDARRANKLRKISLRKLEQELIRLETAKKPLPGEVQFLAGLQRIEYVFVDQKNQDIILAGPAEGWTADPSGFVVGISTGLPVIELGDLLIALRTQREESFQGISCSMDASEVGLKNYADYMNKAKPQFNQRTLNNMLQAIGNFEVTFTGIPTSSHFARVLIAADLTMKRLALNLEPSPVRGIPSYIELLKKSRKRIMPNSMPRWWLAVNYEPLLRDEDELAWKIRGPAVKAMTDQDFLSHDGIKTDAGKSNPLAQKWADSFSKHYPVLSSKMPVFGQVRNCMDLAVVGALLTKYELFKKAGFQSNILVNKKTFRPAKYDVPQFTSPQVSYARNGKRWIVTLSGGIDIDGWSVASNTKVDPDLATLQAKVIKSVGDNWWWD